MARRHIQRVKSRIEESVVRTLSQPTTINELMGHEWKYDVIFVDSDVRANNMPLTEQEAKDWHWKACVAGHGDKVRVVRKRR